MTECAHLDQEGKCHGRYDGFTCIKEKCRADKGDRCSWSTEEGFYCMKFNRFECIGRENCGTLDDYMRFIRHRRENAVKVQTGNGP
jgi:hypothetical protein